MYPKKLKTIGDHIRVKRIDLGLLQKEVAGILGVTTDTITNWEKNRNQPKYWHYLKISDFLGYCLLGQVKSLGEALRRNRFYLGLSQLEAAQRIGIDPGTLGYWERNADAQELLVDSRITKTVNSLLKCSISHFVKS